MAGWTESRNGSLDQLLQNEAGLSYFDRSQL